MLSNQQAVEIASAAMQSAGGGKASGELCVLAHQLSHQCG